MFSTSLPWRLLSQRLQRDMKVTKEGPTHEPELTDMASHGILKVRLGVIAYATWCNRSLHHALRYSLGFCWTGTD